MIRYFYYPDLALTFAIDTSTRHQYWYCNDFKMGQIDLEQDFLMADTRKWTLVGTKCKLEKILTSDNIEEIDRMTLLVKFNVPPLEVK